MLQVSVDGAMVPLRGQGEWAEGKTLALGPVETTASGPAAVELSSCSQRADHETFTRLATVETHRRGMETAGTVGGVVDGADWCQQFLDTQRPDAVRILDFSHAAGYLRQIAQAAFGPGTAAATTWLETQRHTLNHDHDAPVAVLDRIRAVHELVAARPDGAVAAETIAKCRASFEKRQAQLGSATFQQQGSPIGSGLVERANTLVVEARLKGAGRHWAPEHVDPMVALRSVVCADRWDEAWPQICHRLRQHHRHAAHARATKRQTRHPVPPVTTPVPTAPPGPPPDAVPAPAPPAPPRERLSYGPGRPAPNHPWKRARFLLPSRRTLATTSDAKL